jgi:hypothetical protein
VFLLWQAIVTIIVEYLSRLFSMRFELFSDLHETGRLSHIISYSPKWHSIFAGASGLQY